METTVGKRIYTEIDRADPKLVESFRDYPSSNIGDMMNRMYCIGGGIRPYSKVNKLVGTALTVNAPEGDNLTMHYAIEIAKPGDVIVVNGYGSKSRSICGEMMFTEAIARGIAGFVIDGCIRDVDSLITLELPVYAGGVTPQGPWKFGPGEINVPIACGGQVVFPGDIIVGDPDGLVVVRKADAPEVLKATKEKFASEQMRLEEYHRGDYTHMKGLDYYASQVEKKNFQII